MQITKIKSNGENILPISAASKFLWCVRPHLSIIFDSRAKQSLRWLGHSVTDYAAYVIAFRREFVCRLDDLTTAAPLLGLSESEAWGRAKLLDYWLYKNGSRKNKDAVQQSRMLSA